MRQKRNGKFVLRTLASTVSLCILGAITLWLGISVVREAYRKQEVRKEVARLHFEVEELERKNSNLGALIDSLKDSKVLELEAKRRLNLKKPGEEVAVILRDDSPLPAPPERAPVFAPDKREPNPITWWKYVTRD